MNLAFNPFIALGVMASTAATDAAYVFFNAAVSSRRRYWAANWSSIWYMLSAFAVISYTENPLYTEGGRIGAWLGAFASVTWLHNAWTGRQSATIRHEDFAAMKSGMSAVIQGLADRVRAADVCLRPGAQPGTRRRATPRSGKSTKSLSRSTRPGDRRHGRAADAMAARLRAAGFAAADVQVFTPRRGKAISWRGCAARVHASRSCCSPT